METQDYSKEIYDKYFDKKGKLLMITLKDNTVLEGILVSFFHGDSDSKEPFIVKWHFVGKNEMKAYKEGLEMAIDSSQEIGRIIEQKDIKNVKFKN